MMYGGTRAVLYLAGAPIDTVDLLRGVQEMPHGVIYQPVGDQGVRNQECGIDEDCWDLRPWVLRTERGVQPLAEVVPGLDPGLSAPLVVDGELYYLGFEQMGSLYRVFAQWFDFESGSTEALYLGDDMMETDNPGHVPGPVREGLCVLFQFHQRRILLGRALGVCTSAM